MDYSIQYIAEALRAARQVKGLSQRALSKLVQIPQSHISKIENGTVDLQISSLIELARALELDLFLLPRSLSPSVEALQRNKKDPEQRAAYALQEDDYV